MIKQVLFLMFLLSASNIYSQEQKIYVFKDRYNRSVNNFIDQNNSRFADIKIMTGDMLLTNGSVDLEKVEKSLSELYPSPNSIGVLCLDLENMSYNYLMGHNLVRAKKPNESQFKVAEKEFIELIKFVKDMRPKLQVGYFSLPFRIFVDSGQRTNTQTSLDRILKEADILMPSFYVPSPAAHRGLDANLEFLEINLKAAFEYGDRLNKPVLPFVWYFVFPQNSKLRELIPKNEMKTYIDYIFEYNFKGKNVNGVVWWDTAVSFYERNKHRIKQNYIEQKDRKKDINRMDLFYYYFK